MDDRVLLRDDGKGHCDIIWHWVLVVLLLFLVGFNLYTSWSMWRLELSRYYLWNGSPPTFPWLRDILFSILIGLGAILHILRARLIGKSELKIYEDRIEGYSLKRWEIFRPRLHKFELTYDEIIEIWPEKWAFNALNIRGPQGRLQLFINDPRRAYRMIKVRKSLQEKPDG